MSGLTLGGGLSFFSNRYGWACDNVDSYELVTASGSIIHVSANSYPDLYWGLRGGGGNFGVVTQFNLNTIVQGKMWGGARYFRNNSFPAVLDAYYNFATKGSTQDPDAAQIVSFGYLAGMGYLGSAQLHYIKPVENASVFHEFNAIPAIQSSTGIRTHSELVILLDEGVPYGIRNTYWNMSFKVNRDFFTFIIDTLFARLPSIIDVAGILPAMSIQAITTPQLTQMQKNGGNALGLDPCEGPYFILNLATSWNNSADDARIFKFHANFFDTVKSEAKSRGLDNNFIYMNYASQFEDPIAGYGAANKEKLKEISRKYDPTQVFQELNPGYFKLEGPPNPNSPS